MPFFSKLNASLLNNYKNNNNSSLLYNHSKVFQTPTDWMDVDVYLCVRVCVRGRRYTGINVTWCSNYVVPWKWICYTVTYSWISLAGWTDKEFFFFYGHYCVIRESEMPRLISHKSEPNRFSSKHMIDFLELHTNWITIISQNVICVVILRSL